MGPWFSKKEWITIFIMGPLLVYFLAMIDIPFKYWFPLTAIFGDWILEYSIYDIITMSGYTLLVGAVIGAMIVVGWKIWKL